MMAKRLPALAAPCRSSASSRKLSRNHGSPVEAVVGQHGFGARAAAASPSVRRPCGNQSRRVSISLSVNGNSPAAAWRRIRYAGEYGGRHPRSSVPRAWLPGRLRRHLPFAAVAQADDLEDFNRAVEAAISHHRVAFGYLRTGNIELAALELEGMRDAWGKVSALPRPAAFATTQRYACDACWMSRRGLVGTTLVLELGPAEVARESLREDPQAALRPAARTTSWCSPIACSTPTGDGRAVREQTSRRTGECCRRQAAGAYRATLQRCDGMAPAGIRGHAEFRRLIDGALASLAQIPRRSRRATPTCCIAC